MANDNLKNFRTAQGLKQKEIAVKMGISPSMYSMVEAGERRATHSFMSKFKLAFPHISIEAIFFAEAQHSKLTNIR